MRHNCLRPQSHWKLKTAEKSEVFGSWGGGEVHKFRIKAKIRNRRTKAITLSGRTDERKQPYCNEISLGGEGKRDRIKLKDKEVIGENTKD